jgi:hypothetical protein
VVFDWRFLPGALKAAEDRSTELTSKQHLHRDEALTHDERLCFDLVKS